MGATPERPVAFLSYQHWNEFSKLLADTAEQVLDSCGFEVARYVTCEDEPTSANYGVTSVEASLQEVARSHVTVAIVVHSSYGWIVPVEEAPAGVTDGTRSICWLEYEHALACGKTAIALQPVASESFDDTLEPEHRPALTRSLRRWAAQPSAAQDGLRNFRTIVSSQPGSAQFSSVANFRSHLRNALQEWKTSRLPHTVLALDVQPDDSRRELVKLLAGRMESPGCVGVTAPRDSDATAVVAFAAATHKRPGSEFETIVHVNCRGLSLDDIIAELRLAARIPLDDSGQPRCLDVTERLEAMRSLLILNGVEHDGIVEHLRKIETRSTVVVITPDVSLVNSLKIPALDQFEIGMSDLQDSVAKMASQLPAEVRKRETATLEDMGRAVHGWPFGVDLAAKTILDEIDTGSAWPVAAARSNLEKRDFPSFFAETDRFIETVLEKPYADFEAIVTEKLSQDGQINGRQKSIHMNLIAERLRRGGHSGRAVEANELAYQYAKQCGDIRGASISAIELCKSYTSVGRINEAVRIVSEALELPGSSKRSQANLLHQLSRLYERSGEDQMARESLQQSIEIEEELSDETSAELAYPLHSLGQDLIQHGEYAQAIPHLQRALSIEQQSGTSSGQMKVLHTLARAQVHLGQRVEAEMNVRDSLKLGEEVQDPFHTCQVLRTLALILARNGLNENADEYLEQSILLSHQNMHRDRRLVQHAILAAADMSKREAESDQLPKAAVRMSEAAQLASESGLQELFLFAAWRQSQLQLQDPEEAGDPIETLADAYARVIRTANQLDSDVELDRVVQLLVSLLEDGNRMSEARDVCEQVLEVSQSSRLKVTAALKLAQMSEPDSEANTLEGVFRELISKCLADTFYHRARRLAFGWANYLESCGRLSEAEQWLDDSVDHLEIRGAGARHMWPLTRRRVQLLRRLEQVDEALEVSRRAVQLAADTGSSRQQSIAAIDLAEVHVDVGNEAEALTLILKECERLEQSSFCEFNTSGSTTSDITGGAFDRSDHPLKISRVLRRIDPNQARTFLRQIVQDARDNGQVERVVIASREIARIHEADDFVVQAKIDLRAAADFASHKENRAAQALMWQELARLSQRENQHTEADLYFKTCIQHRKEAKNPIHLAWSLRLASLHLRHNLNDPVQALDLAKQALDLQHELGRIREIVLLQNGIGALYKDLGKLDQIAGEHDSARERLQQAEELLREAVANATQAGDNGLQASTLLTLSAVLRAQGQSIEERLMLQDAIRHLEDEPQSSTFIYALYNLAHSFYTARRGPGAVRTLQRFRKCAADHDYPMDKQFEADALLGSAYRVCGLLPEALTQLEITADNLERNDPDAEQGLDEVTKRQFQEVLSFRRAIVLNSMNRPAEALLILENLDANRLARLRNAEVAAEDFPIRHVMARAKTYAVLGHRDKCHEALVEAEAHLPEVPGGVAVFHMDRSRCHFVNGDLEVSLEDAHAALEHSGRIADQGARRLSESFAHARIALLLINLGELDDADKESAAAYSAAFESESLQACMNACDVRVRALIASERYEDVIAVVTSALKHEEKEFRKAGMQPASVTKQSVALNIMAERCLRELGRDSEADEHHGKWNARRRSLEERGVVFSAFDLAESDRRISLFSSVELAVPEPAIPKVVTGDRVRGRVESIRSEGTQSGVYVELEDGTVGFCPAREIFFVGTPRNPRLRFDEGETHPFVIKSDRGFEGGLDVPVVLSQAEFLKPVINSLNGQIVEGQVRRMVTTDQRQGVEVELASGELLRLNLRHEVLIGKDVTVAPHSTLRMRLRVERKPTLHVRASAKPLYEDALENLKKSRTAVCGELVGIDGDRAAIWLAPGVSGTCPRDRLTLTPDAAIHTGCRFAAVVKSCSGGSIELDRADALKRRLKNAAGQVFVGRIRRPGRRYLWVELAPGFSGFLSSSNLSREYRNIDLTTQFRDGDAISVRILKSGDKKLPHGRHRFQVDLAADDRVGESFETTNSLMHFVAKPTVEVGGLVQAALRQARNELFELETGS